jgi:hypothetical protein
MGCVVSWAGGGLQPDDFQRFRVQQPAGAGPRVQDPEEVQVGYDVGHAALVEKLAVVPRLDVIAGLEPAGADPFSQDRSGVDRARADALIFDPLSSHVSRLQLVVSPYAQHAVARLPECFAWMIFLCRLLPPVKPTIQALIRVLMMP